MTRDKYVGSGHYLDALRRGDRERDAVADLKAENARLTEALAAARAEAESREAERDLARHVLSRLEWSANVYGLKACPTCTGKQPGQSGMRSFGGHTRDCHMASALGIPMEQRIGPGSARAGAAP